MFIRSALTPISLIHTVRTNPFPKLSGLRGLTVTLNIICLKHFLLTHLCTCLTFELKHCLLIDLVQKSTSNNKRLLWNYLQFRKHMYIYYLSSCQLDRWVVILTPFFRPGNENSEIKWLATNHMAANLGHVFKFKIGILSTTLAGSAPIFSLTHGPESVYPVS